LLEELLSTSIINFLENSLYHIEPLKDNISNTITLEKSLTVQAKTDKNVEEIINFMKKQLTVSLKDKYFRLIGKNSLFNDTAEDKKYNVNSLPSELKKTITFLQKI